jgi:hypothetical protein
LASITPNLTALHIWLLLTFGSNGSLWGQTLFSEVALDRGVAVMSDHLNWGLGISFHDWDRDGWPDLTYARTGLPPAFFRNDGGYFSQVIFNIPNQHEMKAVIWVDYDNDGDADLFVTRLFGERSLYANDGIFNFTDVTTLVGISAHGGMSMGASWADVNRDGFLDLYICNYSAENGPTNEFYLSNGDGTFSEMTSIAGIGDGSRASFQSTFPDIDMDGWPDLFVSNDRVPYLNGMYRNKATGEGTFMDVSLPSGTAIGIDAMSNTVGDFDNDGDLDIYQTNHEAGNVLFVNDGNGVFEDMAVSYGVVVNRICWGALWLDQDLDGWLDLYVATSPLNNTAQTNIFPDRFFTNVSGVGFALRDDSGFADHISRSYCAATADFDNDGAPDIAISNKQPFRAELWRNNHMGGHFIKVALEGTVSNRDAIGATVRCFAGGLMQTRYTLCGEAHFGQSSQYLHFGLGDAENVDSLVILWPSGVREKFIDLAINTTLHLVEGEAGNNLVVSFDGEAPAVNLDAPIAVREGLIVFTSDESVEAVLLDVSGRVLGHWSQHGRGDRILATLPAGIYVLRWNTGNGRAGAIRFAR